MAEATATTTAQSQDAENSTVFSGSPRNFAAGFAMLIASALTFTMKMTDVFFAEAIAWTFLVWGILFIYNELIPLYQSYTVTDKALIVDTPMRPVERYKVWDWANIHRVEIHVKRNQSKHEEKVMQIYYTAPGDSIIDREDRQFDPQLAHMVIERAALKPVNKEISSALNKLPGNKGIYVWNQSGK